MSAPTLRRMIPSKQHTRTDVAGVMEGLMQGHVQFSVDGQVCFIVPEGAPNGNRNMRIVGSVTLGERRHSICSPHLDRTRAAPSELLTARELQIAVLIAQGFANKAI